MEIRIARLIFRFRAAVTAIYTVLLTMKGPEFQLNFQRDQLISVSDLTRLVVRSKSSKLQPPILLQRLVNTSNLDWIVPLRKLR